MADVVVAGAGVFGAWTAHHLVAAGARVTLVDAYGAANARASSGDHSRIIRCGYGPDEIYSRWARRSLMLWRQFFESDGPAEGPLFHPCGVLWLAAGDDPYTVATRHTLELVGYRVEALDRLSFRTRFPHIHANDVGIALLEPESGVLMARRAVRTLVAGLARRGTQVLRTAAIAPQGEGRVRAIRLTDGRERAADAFVFACGPWLPKVFPDLLGGMIRPTRQVLLHFGTPAGDDRFGPQHTPAWVDFAAGVYGVPDLEDEGLKVGIDTHGPPIDPDTADRVVDEASIATARAWLCRRIPALADAPLVSGRVCQYENTSSGDFLIDRHPLFDNVWIAGGGSGHGFKHGPAVGEYVAGLVSGTVRPEPRFQLTTKGTEPARAVF